MPRDRILPSPIQLSQPAVGNMAPLQARRCSRNTSGSKKTAGREGWCIQGPRRFPNMLDRGWVVRIAELSRVRRLARPAAVQDDDDGPFHVDSLQRPAR